MSEHKAQQDTTLNYATVRPTRQPSRVQAIVLTLPSVLCVTFIPLSIWTGWALRIGPAPVLLLGLLAISTSFVTLAEYQPIKPKPAYVIVCLTVSWCIVSVTAAFALFIFIALVLGAIALGV